MSCPCRDALADRLLKIHKEKLHEAMASDSAHMSSVLASAAWAYLEAAEIVRGEK